MAKNTLIPRFTPGLIAVVMILAGLAANAQDEQEKPRIVRVEDRWEDKIVLELTHDTWLNAPAGVEFRTPSLGFKGYLFSDYSFGKSDFSFAWGLGVSIDNVRSNAQWVQELLPNGELGDQVLTPFPEGYEYDKHKFVTTFIELPLELRYIQTGRNPFKLAVGFRLGYMLSNHQKIVDTEGKRKFYDFEDMNSFRYGLSARLGVGKVQLTGFYSLVPLVEPSKGTDVVAVSMGLAFTFIK